MPWPLRPRHSADPPRLSRALPPGALAPITEGKALIGAVAVVNPQSGKCLDDSGSGGSGTQVIIYDCNGEASQQWTLP